MLRNTTSRLQGNGTQNTKTLTGHDQGRVDLYLEKLGVGHHPKKPQPRPFGLCGFILFYLVKLWFPYESIDPPRKCYCKPIKNEQFTLSDSLEFGGFHRKATWLRLEVSWVHVFEEELV